jgi:uncharacterized membrane protein YeiH
MWNLPPSDTVLHVLLLLAAAAQAMTAALAAGRRSMDWVGVCVTALGGGSLRDVLLGHYPLLWVANPYYLVLTAGAALVTIMMARLMHRLQLAFLVLDAIGLVVFTVAGCDVALQLHESLPIVIIAGMITGCAGGVLRDILCNDIPLLFRSELYASVSVVTGVIYIAAEPRSRDRAGIRGRPEFPAAGDPLQMGDAEIRLYRRAAVNWRAGIRSVYWGFITVPAYACCPPPSATSWACPRRRGYSPPGV